MPLSVRPRETRARIGVGGIGELRNAARLQAGATHDDVAERLIARHRVARPRRFQRLHLTAARVVVRARAGVREALVGAGRRAAVLAGDVDAHVAGDAVLVAAGEGRARVGGARALAAPRAAARIADRLALAVDGASARGRRTAARRRRAWRSRRARPLATDENSGTTPPLHPPLHASGPCCPSTHCPPLEPLDETPDDPVLPEDPELPDDPVLPDEAPPEAPEDPELAPPELDEEPVFGVTEPPHAARTRTTKALARRDREERMCVLTAYGVPAPKDR